MRPRRRSRQAFTSAGSRVSHDLAQPGKERRAAVRPGVVEQDEGAAHPCHARASGPYGPSQESRIGLQRLRPLQDRGRPFQFAHDGSDDRRLPLCREAWRDRGLLARTARVEADLYGSLALTGKGHATDRAVLLGLSGERPDGIDPDAADADGRRASARPAGSASAARHDIAFDEARDLRFLQRERLPHHSNGMRFTAFDAAGEVLDSAVSYSVGGGAVVEEADVARNAPPEGAGTCPIAISSGDQLLAIAARAGLSIAEIARDNERAALPTPRSTPGSTRSPTPCRPASTAAWRRAASCPAGST